MCVCLRCELLAFEAALAVCRENVGQGVRGKESREYRKTRRKGQLKSSVCLEERSMVFDSNSISIHGSLFKPR